MKLVYGISRWANPSRASARHIDDGTGKPLCGGSGRKAFTWEREEGKPTCKRCIAIYKKPLVAKASALRAKKFKTQPRGVLT